MTNTEEYRSMVPIKVGERVDGSLSINTNLKEIHNKLCDLHNQAPKTMSGEELAEFRKTIRKADDYVSVLFRLSSAISNMEGKAS